MKKKTARTFQCGPLGLGLWNLVRLIADPPERPVIVIGVIGVQARVGRDREGPEVEGGSGLKGVHGPIEAQCGPMRKWHRGAMAIR
ncbi:hypothetical protein N789_01930 [Arenimonas oryziterrae DSM 21050 = YC6267]|uniref:Uncharacterized protein n=1 Tax=Arenimonas oryziterrae DSM 21050 = YC6267 TaxID=1121015 RepID=A0A091AZR4_9GAMM|nr:hypothetical protein N789_01930 [Arenimonas oryziterrae DSM 21050 = YC6267]